MDLARNCFAVELCPVLGGIATFWVFTDWASESSHSWTSLQVKFTALSLFALLDWVSRCWVFPNSWADQLWLSLLCWFLAFSSSPIAAAKVSELQGLSLKWDKWDEQRRVGSSVLGSVLWASMGCRVPESGPSLEMEVGEGEVAVS
jgi:hypothetical protein